MKIAVTSKSFSKNKTLTKELLKTFPDTKLNNEEIVLALSFTRNLLVNKFFIPNNLMFPKSRIILENYFN